MAPIQCLFRLVNHFVTFGEFKHEWQSKNASFGSNSSVMVPCDIEIWQIISTNNRTSLPCQSKLCASFYRHLRIQTRVTVQKWTNLANFVLTSVTLTLDLGLLAWTSLLVMIIIWWYDNGTIVKKYDRFTSLLYISYKISDEVRCTAFCSDMLMKSSSWSYFPWWVISVYSGRLSSIQLI